MHCWHIVVLVALLLPWHHCMLIWIASNVVRVMMAASADILLLALKFLPVSAGMPVTGSFKDIETPFLWLYHLFGS